MINNFGQNGARKQSDGPHETCPDAPLLPIEARGQNRRLYQKIKSPKVIVVLSMEKRFKDIWTSKDHFFTKHVFHSYIKCD